MKRRAFFGVAAGAVVAGPGMAKEAVTSGLASLRLQDAIGAGEGISGLMGGNAIDGSYSLTKQVDFIAHSKDMLSKLLGMTAAQRQRLKAQQPVHQLDTDLASYRSFSLAAKMDIQRERNLNALLSERKSWWQRAAEGITGEDPDQLNIW